MQAVQRTTDPPPLTRTMPAPIPIPTGASARKRLPHTPANRRRSSVSSSKKAVSISTIRTRARDSFEEPASLRARRSLVMHPLSAHSDDEVHMSHHHDENATLHFRPQSLSRSTSTSTEDYDSEGDDENCFFDDSATSISSCSTQSTGFSRHGSVSYSPTLHSPTVHCVARKAHSNSCVSAVTFTPSVAASGPSDIVKVLTDVSLLNSAPEGVRNSSNIVSNLTSSFKTFRNSLQRSSQSLIPFSLSFTPRMTDDRVPEPKDSEALAPLEEELETFSVLQADLSHALDKAPVNKTFRNRDQRINSKFLSMYAYDFSARASGVLPNLHTNEEFSKLINKNKALKLFHSQHNFYKISNMSRDKLWNSVILPPRTDTCPRPSVDHSSYVYVGHDEKKQQRRQSLTRMHGDYLPWAPPSAEDERLQKNTFSKPAGIMKNGSVCNNGPSPSSGVSRTQFTVKGWCNSRWIATTDEG